MDSERGLLDYITLVIHIVMIASFTDSFDTCHFMLVITLFVFSA